MMPAKVNLNLLTIKIGNKLRYTLQCRDNEGNKMEFSGCIVTGYLIKNIIFKMLCVIHIHLEIL